MLILLPENWGYEQKPEVTFFFTGNAYDSNSNNWKKCEGAEGDIVQCIGCVIQLEHEHIA